MDEIGYVFSPLDLKILILCLLRRLPEEIDRDRLLQLCQKSGVVNYFDFSICLDELEQSGLIAVDENFCEITERGRGPAETLESSLPYSVRQHAVKTACGEAEEMSRQQNIVAGHRLEEGSCMAELALSDGVSSILELRLLCADEEQAKKIQRRFRRNAEEIYQNIIRLLSES